MHEKKKLNSNEKQIFLDLSEDDITKTLLTDFFTDRYSVKDGKIIPSRFNTFDEFTLMKGDYPGIKENTLTNCGLFIFNKFLLEKDWVEYTGYINTPIDADVIKNIQKTLVDACLEDETGVLVPKYIDFMDKLTWLELTYHTDICTSMTIKSSKPLPKVQRRKNELLKKYEKELKEGNTVIAVQIQEELIKIAKEELKNDQTIELYESGARGSFDNAYRQEMLIKGPIFNASRNKFDIMTKSLYEGADKDDLPAFANAVVDGLYPKALGPCECGYDSKKLRASLQGEILDERGSDCGSKYLSTVKITKDNLEQYKYHFISTPNGYIRLDSTNQSKYIGKTVKMRTPDTCVGKQLCNKCCGDRYYLLGIKTIGLTADKAATTLLNGKMKQSHDTTVRTFEVDPGDTFKPFM